MSWWPGQTRQIACQWVVVLIVSVAGVVAPSLLSAQTVIITDTTLTADNVGGITIGAHGIVLDCNGHRISGAATGITLNGKTSVTVRNCVVTNNGNGIVVSSSSGNTFEANTVEGNAGGIQLTAAGGNMLRRNTVRRNSQFGVRIDTFSNGNNLRENTISNNARGLDVLSSVGNTVVNNNFFDNQVQAAVVGTTWFSLALPTGGNYWTDFDTPAEGCSDQDGDGFCDAPRVVVSPWGQDNLPWTRPFGEATVVSIDIKPASLNPGAQGTIPVAIYSTSSFDVSSVDLSTVKLAGMSVALLGNGSPQASLVDLNGDGLLDLLVHISTEALDVAARSTNQTGTLTLEGRTLNGGAIRGTDSVKIVGD